MTKFLKKFTTHRDYDKYVAHSFEKPNISICQDEPDHIHYNPRGEAPEPNEVWYWTASGHTLDKLNEPAAFLGEYNPDAEIISNTYENGKGVVKLNVPVEGLTEAFYETDVVRVVIPDGAWFIYNGFYSCTDLQSVYIPKSVTEFQGLDFYDCYNLWKIEYGGAINDWRNIYWDYDNPFRYCGDIEVHCIDGVTYVGDGHE